MCVHEVKDREQARMIDWKGGWQSRGNTQNHYGEREREREREREGGGGMNACQTISDTIQLVLVLKAHPMKSIRRAHSISAKPPFCVVTARGAG